MLQGANHIVHHLLFDKIYHLDQNYDIFEKSSVVASITASVFVDPSRVPSDHGKIDEKINDVNYYC